MSSTRPDYSSRIERAARALRAAGVDLLLLTPGADMLYLTGFAHGHAHERLLAFVLRADESASWICPAMNAVQVEAAALKGHPVRGWNDAETCVPALNHAIDGAGSIAFDDDARSAFLLDLLAQRPDVRLVKASSILRKLRMRKDAAELLAMRAAAATVDQTVTEAMALCAAGRSEAEIEQMLREALLRRCPESSIAFTIVASGPNSALPHHETGRRALERGDVVILDFGTRLDDYHSDITVACSVGAPTHAEARKVYGVVWEAAQAAIAEVKPGVACEAVDRAARSLIERAGYGPHFLHRTGHGIGIQVHEPPYIVGGNAELLEEGMTFSIEPGIYLPGRFGVRLEVILACSAGGAEVLNAPRARELPIV